MPPRSRKTASPARSRSRSNSRPSSRRNSVSKPAPVVDSHPSSPPPDPAAVQRLIDEAMARAAARRSSTPAGRGAASAAQTRAKACRPCIVSRCFASLFPARSSIYSPRTTAVLTDLIGAFLVTCLAIYFTTAGYLFYRDTVLA